MSSTYCWHVLIVGRTGHQKPQTKMTQLFQSAFLKGSQEFILDEQGLVRVRRRLNLTNSEYTLPLDQFDPEPSKVRGMPRQWVIGSFLFGLPAFAVVVIALIFGWSFASIAALTFFLPLFLITFCKLLKESVNATIFHQRHTRQSLLVIWNQRPNKEASDSFVMEFSKRVAGQIGKRESSLVEQTMVGELKELHSLFTSGILSQGEYEAGKRKVLGVNEPTTLIGFRP